MTDLPHVPGIADDFRIGSSTNLRESPIFEESAENIIFLWLRGEVREQVVEVPDVQVQDVGGFPPATGRCWKFLQFDRLALDFHGSDLVAMELIGG